MYRTQIFLFKYYLPLAVVIGIVLALGWQISIPWYVPVIVIPVITLVIVLIVGQILLALEARQRSAAGGTGAAGRIGDTDEGPRSDTFNLPAGFPALGLMRGPAAESQTHEPQPPPRPEEILHALANDPELLTAVADLRVALADPELRPTVQAALQAFAQAAKKEQ